MIRNRAAWLAIVAAAGLLGGAAWPPPPVPVTSERDAAWALPAAAQMQRLADSEFGAATRRMRWTGDASGAGGDQGGGPQAWKLLGISHDPEPMALVSVGTKKADVQRVPVGATLPDGSQLLSVASESITVQAEGCRQVYQPYRAEPVSTQGECAGEGRAAPEQRKSQ